MIGGLKSKPEKLNFFTIKATFFPGTNYLLTEDLQRFKISRSWYYLKYKYPKYYTLTPSVLGPNIWTIVSIFTDENHCEEIDYTDIIKKLGKHI